MAGFLAGKNAVVTGSSRGIGAATARALAAEGCRVMLTGRDGAALAEVTRSIEAAGGRCASFEADLTARGNPAALIGRVGREFGSLDIVVANAGNTRPGTMLDYDDDRWQATFGLKFFAHTMLAKAAWPLLRASKGSWVSIAGGAGRTPHAASVGASTVNAACMAFAKALADMGREDEIQVNCINPGAVETGRMKVQLKLFMEQHKLEEPEARIQFAKDRGYVVVGQPEDIGALVLLIVSPHGRYFHGATIDMDGGSTPGI